MNGQWLRDLPGRGWGAKAGAVRRLVKLAFSPLNVGEAVKRGVEVGFAEFAATWDGFRARTLMGQVRAAVSGEVFVVRPVVVAKTGGDLVWEGDAVAETRLRGGEWGYVGVGSVRFTSPPQPVWEGEGEVEMVWLSFVRGVTRRMVVTTSGRRRFVFAFASSV